ncbi:Hydrophobin_2-domain-containing protein [Sphaerulina musiva SO2202]|uniref:Hydrophobin_2-domain-containing protein n=1 Tax=Sphaerulina musiva (strain SO2202) TaxID=692275 RepID=M3BV53_SPHMS|nr:Hydrophobin_2-domain-containing protein [Sphaerulina musiva SO2202]EMF11204.1 Hydrophobin_2-domain-containing protein [Sphaerulina musiva SO2202]
MRFFTFVATTLAAVAMASPVPDSQGGYSAHGGSGQGGWNGHAEPLCPAGLASNPQCCQVDVGGVLDLTCQTAPGNPHNIDQFQQACASIGRSPQCCSISLLGNELLCNNPLP